MGFLKMFKKKAEVQGSIVQEGLRMLERGEVDDALELLEKAREEGEDRLLANYAYGRALVEALRFEEALELAEALEQEFGEDHRPPILAAMALKEINKLNEAEAKVEKAMAVKPSSSEAWVLQAQILNAREMPEQAMEALNTVLKLDKRHVPALREAAYASLQLRDLDGARWNCSRAMEGDAHDGRTMVLNSVISMIEGNLDAALDDVEEAIETNPYLVEAFNHKGYLLRAMGRPEEAELTLRQALDLNPGRVSVHYYLGLLYAELDEMGEARKAFDNALELKPAHGLAHLNRARITKYVPEDGHIRSMENVLAGLEEGGQTALYLHFALAKAYEDCGEYDKAFEHLHRGNSIKWESLDYSPRTELDMIKGIIESYTPEVFQAGSGMGQESELPVFIIGMPRCGSTLVEQILDCHPAIVSTGETDLFRRVLNLAGRARGHGEDMIHYILESANMAGPQYLDTLETFAPSTHKALEATRITDKTLNNFLYLGLIHLAMPNARVIHCRRDPVDICLSCYKQIFDFSLEYTYDLETLGTYYRYYHELMLHWEDVLPGRYLELRYEELVEEPEREIRRILDWLGLEFSPACLEFHKNKRQVKTASLAQVRQPMYKGSVKLWRRYEKHLAPLLEVLGPLVER